MLAHQLLWKSYTQWWWWEKRNGETTPLIANTPLNTWLMHFARWLGILTDLFYLAHFLAICVVLSISSTDACTDQTIAILLFHHLVAIILMCAHLRPPFKDEASASDDAVAVDDRAIICFGTVKVFIVLLCIVVSIRCGDNDVTSDPFLSCIYAYLVGAGVSGSLFVLLSVIHSVSTKEF